MSKLYRRIAEEDLETTPVQYVAVHPLRWRDRGEPTAGFVEVDDDPEELKALLREARIEIVELLQCRGEGYQNTRELVARIDAALGPADA